MPATMSMVKSPNVSVTMYRGIEDTHRINQMVKEGTKEEDAEFLVLKNRLRREIGEGAPHFFPINNNVEEENE